MDRNVFPRRKKPKSIRQLVDDALSRRIKTNKIPKGFNASGSGAEGMICGDCGDGACEGCP